MKEQHKEKCRGSVLINKILNIDLKKLTRAIKETQQFEEEFNGKIVDTLKENVDDVKEGFASQTMLMAEMTTSIDEMRDAIE